jgi:hypothetical protein
MLWNILDESVRETQFLSELRPARNFVIGCGGGGNPLDDRANGDGYRRLGPPGGTLSSVDSFLLARLPDLGQLHDTHTSLRKRQDEATSA